MIHKNLYNPVPFHSSADKWYNRRRTFKGGMSKIYAPNGYILPFQFTISNSSFVSGYSAIVVNGNIKSASAINADEVVLNGAATSIKLVKSGDKYEVHLINPIDGECVMIDNNGRVILVTFSEFLALTGTKTFKKVGGESGTTTFIFASVTANYISAELCNESGEVVADITDTLCLLPILVPSEYRNNNARYAYFACKRKEIATPISDGCYYIKLGGSSDIEEVVSEPFNMVTDTSRFIRAEYKSDYPIIKSDAYIPFKSIIDGAFSMELYIDSYIMMPTNAFEEDVQSIKGYRFIQDRVSSTSHRFSFPSSHYFVEAVILMWHCPLLKFNDDMDTYLVDYMKQPEVSWNDDNHFCNLSVEFTTDTITQSNGYHVATTERLIGGGFSEGFNEGFNI